MKWKVGIYARNVVDKMIPINIVKITILRIPQNQKEKN